MNRNAPDRTRAGARRAVLGLATGIALSLGAFAAQAQSYTMAIAYLPPEDMFNNEVHPSLVHFKNLVEGATDGDIRVELFGGGQLGSEVETGRQAQTGRTLQSTIISSGAMSSFYSDYQIVTTPFLFPNYRVARGFFDGPWMADFMKGTVEAAELRYLGTMDDGGGFVAFTTNRRLIRTLEDIEGLIIRVEENPAHVATMRALGASATPLPWGEVQTALATGLADGQFNAPGVQRAYQIWDVQDYTTLSGHVYNSLTWLVSERWFQELPDEYQRIVITSAREAVQVSHGIAALQAIVGWDDSCREFDECHILAAEERERMADIARPAWKEWITTDFGVEASLVDELWAEVDRIAEDLDATQWEVYGQ